MMSQPRDLIALVARILIVALFLFSGWGKLMGFAGATASIASKNLPLPQLLAAATVIVELGGAALVIVGYKARWAALALAAFTVAASLLFHDYWNLADAGQRQMQYIQFWKNIAIIGGLLMVAGYGPGRLSIDGRTEGT